MMTAPAAERPPEIARETICLNCGTEVGSPYCGECGQRADTHVLTVREMAADLLSGLFSYDSKLLVTVAQLILKPGRLTTEFTAGRRVRFAGPFQLYFWINTVCFLTFSLLFASASKRMGEANYRTLIAMTGTGSLLLTILFAGRRRRFLEHLVASVPLHAFLTIVLTFCLLGTAILFRTVLLNVDSLVMSVMAGSALIYSFAAFRRIYPSSVFVTILKWAAFWAAYVAVILIVRGVFVPRR